MKYNDIHKLAEQIAKYHTTFNDHPCLGTTRIFDTLMRTRDFLKSEPAALGANFTANFWLPVDSKTIQNMTTVITIGLADDGESLTFEERPASKVWKTAKRSSALYKGYSFYC